MSENQPNGQSSAADSKGPLSPGLRARAGQSAFEFKYPLTIEQARDILEVARRDLVLDPYCDPRLGDGYEVHGLYFDTPQFHVYRREGLHARHKLRLRRYGGASHLYLEHKMKSKGRVAKRRTPVTDVEVPNLLAPRTAADWSGVWFRRRMKTSRVVPVCEVSYLRTAYSGEESGEAFRLTLDRHLRCRPFVDWRLSGINGDGRSLAEQFILELKFCDTMPAFFKQLVADFHLTQGRVSKYRLSVEACGLAASLANNAGSSLANGGSDASIPRSA